MVLSIQRGKTIQSIVYVTNIGSAGTFFIECYLFSPLIQLGVPLNGVVSGGQYEEITLATGQSETATFRGVIPLGSTLGLYDSVARAKLGMPTGEVVGERTEPDEVNVLEEELEQFIEPTDDSFVKLQFPTSNYGSFEYFNVFAYFADNDFGDGLLKFVIPNVTVSQAFLRLYLTIIGPEDVGNMIVMASSNTSWTEGSVTWNTRPSYDIDPNIEWPITEGGSRWINIDVTDFIKANVGKAVTFALTAGSDNMYAHFFSKEYYTNKPNLRIISSPIILPKLLVTYCSADDLNAANIIKNGLTNYYNITLKQGALLSEFGNYDMVAIIGGDQAWQGCSQNLYTLVGFAPPTPENNKCLRYGGYASAIVYGIAGYTSDDTLWLADKFQTLAKQDNLPTITTCYTTGPAELTPVDDCTLKAQYPDENFNAEVLQVVGSYYGEKACAIKFDLAGALDYTSAKLRLVPTNFGGTPAIPRTIQIMDTNPDWFESTVTWNNLVLWGNIVRNFEASIIEMTPDGFLEFDVTDFYNYAKTRQQWLSLFMHWNSSIYQLNTFKNKEDPNPLLRPKLILS